MRVGFVVLDMTHLRYFIPLAKMLPTATEVTFYLWAGGHKYNSLATGANMARLDAIMVRELPNATISDDPDAHYDVVFQVETGKHLRCDRRIAIQHGFDCAIWPDQLNDEVDAFICTTELNAQRARDIGVTKATAPPYPVAMWDICHSEPPVRNVVVFYPDQGDVHLANSVIDFLHEKGYAVIVKQRRKHQPISSTHGTHTYDDVWYPSESIEFPLGAWFTVGFGSSAYADLTAVGLNYVNIDIHAHAHPWSAFAHPDIPNYVRVTDPEQVFSALETACGSFERHVPVIDGDQINAWLVGLLRCMP